jgi:hypothetical protein
MDETERHDLAKAPAAAVKGCYGHLATSLVVGTALFLVSVLTATT